MPTIPPIDASKNPLATLTDQDRAYYRQVQDWLRLTPPNFDMNNWVCGTACCIGGKLAILKGYIDLGMSSVQRTETGWRVQAEMPWLDAYDIASGILGADKASDDFRHSIFYYTAWPDGLGVKFEAAEQQDDLETMCQLAIRRIDLLLNEGR